MKEVYSIKFGVEYLICMVDLFGRAGNLDEIKSFIYDNGVFYVSLVWKVFLFFCRVYRNYDMGKWVFEKLFEFELLDVEFYFLLLNMCVISNRWEEFVNVRSLMQKKGVKKYFGLFWI